MTTPGYYDMIKRLQEAQREGDSETKFDTGKWKGKYIDLAPDGTIISFDKQ